MLEEWNKKHCEEKLIDPTENATDDDDDDLFTFSDIFSNYFPAFLVQECRFYTHTIHSVLERYFLLVDQLKPMDKRNHHVKYEKWDVNIVK